MRVRCLIRPVLVGVFWGSGAGASLAPSEVEQVRYDVSTAQNVGHVRALVARPDLTSAEAGAAMAAAMSGTPLDAAHGEYLGELVFGSPSAASRPMLAVAVVRGLLARADTVFTQHQDDLDRNAAALSELARVYALVEHIVGADSHADISDSARTDCEHALAEHFARHTTVLRPDAPVSAAVSTVRAQAAIALLDSMPDTPGQRVDAANDIGLSGPRRAALIELGLLVLDTGGSDTRVTTVRALLERQPGARDGATAIVIGDRHASQLRARKGVVVAVDAAPETPLTEIDSPWGNEAALTIDAATMAVARALAAASLRRALERRSQLRSAIERDGGEAGVVTMAAMLALDAQRTIEVAAARFLAGKRESAAWLADAIGALAVFSPSPVNGADGLAIALGRADGAHGAVVRATRVVLDSTGGASALRLNGHTWRIVRDARGVVTGLLRDATPVSANVLPDTRPPAVAGNAWSGGGLVFARLAGAPRAAFAPGPRVWVFGSGVSDAIVSPSPGDDIVLETDLRVEGGPAGVMVRAVPGSSGPFKAVSVLVAPGAPPRAALLVADGFGVETAAAPVIELTGTQALHLRIKVKGQKIEAKIGKATLEATLPDGFEHGDVALRAYPGASVEANGWRVTQIKPKLGW
jgi:hypothetical protein